MSHLPVLIRELNSLKNPTKAKDLSWFFKTGPGQYGAGDKFLGIVVPLQRQLVRLYWDVINLTEIQILLKSPYHEFRLIALLILVRQYQTGDDKTKKNIYNFYLKNLKYVNNWDLVDLSARDIIGAYCFEHQNYSILTKLSQSTNLWKKRISLVSTHFLIKKDIFSPTLAISRALLTDPHDLIHKALGWMLREVGNRSLPTLIDFLDTYAVNLPRTALRYAIEKFPPDLRLHYLKLK